MSFELSRSQQVQVNAVEAGYEFEAAWNYANRIMHDVKRGHPGYDDIWMMHFYGWYQMRCHEPDPMLEATIEGLIRSLDELEDRIGPPDELGAIHEDEPCYPVAKGIRGRVLKWIISVERGSGLEEVD